MNLRKNQSGFTLVEVLLILILALLISFIGWTVLSKNKDKPKTATQTSTNATSTPTNNAAWDEKIVQVLQADNTSFKLQSPSEVAKTNDQKDVLLALHKNCPSETPYVLISHSEFSGDKNDNYEQDGSHVHIAAGCAPKDNFTWGDTGGTAQTFLHKTGDTWKIDAQTQAQVTCDKLDGYGYPASWQCAESDAVQATTRAPK